MNFQPNSPEARDIAYHLHAYTNARQHQKDGPMIISRGEGAYVVDNNGKRYLESLAGLWSVALGFSEERLIEAATKQMRELPFYHDFAHKSHGPVIDVAEKLISLAPVPMSKVYFTNSGSEANDTVMKLLRYRSNAMGEPKRKKFISRHRGYHGVTIAAGSLTGLAYAHNSFDLPIEGVFHTTCPHYWREGHDGESEEDFATRMATELEALIEAEGPETIAAFIGEPVMAAGGVVVPPAGYWQKVQEVLDRHGVLLIADEVICGFGRTGKMFGSETFGIKPDVMVMSKQLSSSYIPFSAFMINEKVFEPIADESNRLGTLGTGFTAGGHPVGAAVALENINIIEERGLVERTAELGAAFQKKLREFSSHPLVGEVRGIGLIAALELVTDKDKKTAIDPPGTLGGKMNAALMANGVISRNLTDAIAFCPPLVVSQDDLDFLLEQIGRSLDDVAATL